ncbi:MAG: MBL fold metallo-hydrolase [Bradymonadaceae bacterium]
MARVEFISHSGAGQAGANAFELRLGERRLLLDCGATSRARPKWIDAIDGVDAIWLSHVHWDHVGSLSHAVAGYPRVPLLAGTETADLLPFALKAAWGNDPQGEKRGAAIAGRVQKIAELKFTPILDSAAGSKVPGINIMRFPAGHTLGASMLLVEWERETQRPFRVLYTGDFCTHDQVLVKGALIPRVGPDFEIDVLMSEGILGTDLEADGLEYTDEAHRLAADMGANQGPRLLAVSPLGEAFEALAILIAAGHKPFVHDWLQPLFEIWRERFPDELSLLENRFVDAAQARQLLQGGQIVAAAGEQLQTSSTAGRLALEIAHLDDAFIAVFNRVSPNTPAGLALAAPRGQQLDWKGRPIIVRAQFAHYRLLNHAPRWQILATIKALAPRQVIFVHGKKGALHALSRALISGGFDGDVHIPQNREIISLLR